MTIITKNPDDHSVNPDFYGTKVMFLGNKMTFTSVEQGRICLSLTRGHSQQYKRRSPTLSGETRV